MANTGYKIVVYVDTNPYSETYGTTYSDRIYDDVTCPLPTYKLTYVLYDGTTGNVQCDGNTTLTQSNVGSINVVSATIGSCVETIGLYAFLRRNNLTTVIIPNNVTTIGEGAFSQCTSLTNVRIPSSITSIADRAFDRCNALTSIGGTGSGASLELPNTVTSINNRVFYYCQGLTTVNLPNVITSIGDGAFQDCNNLVSITIPNSVTSIGSSAFFFCSNLPNITIPDSVTSIDSQAFDGCWDLTSVTILATIPPTLANVNAFNRNSNDRKFYVPAESVELYKTATNWSSFASLIEPISV